MSRLIALAILGRLIVVGGTASAAGCPVPEPFAIEKLDMSEAIGTLV